MQNIPAETDSFLKPSTDPEGPEDVNLSRFLEAFFDQVPAILYIKDEIGRYVKINRYCEKTFQVPDRQARGSTDYNFFSDRDRRRIPTQRSARPGYRRLPYLRRKDRRGWG